MEELRKELTDLFLHSVKNLKIRLGKASINLSRGEEVFKELIQDTKSTMNKTKLDYLKNTRLHYSILSGQAADLLKSPVVHAMISDKFELKDLGSGQIGAFQSRVSGLSNAKLEELEKSLDDLTK